MADLELLTQREAADLLRCSETTVKRLRLSGALGYLPGAPVRIPKGEIERYLSEQRARHEAAAQERPEPPQDARQRARRASLVRRYRKPV
ncbi:helix-turn-helix domain-containing protein [Nitratireductor aquimarinus]|uniref:helix-turn-helix domain-containing protein n=1 Tax=Nitratireductor aquimarinus TaxID=889300 RepID=UPI001A8EFCF0|nr:helix-turn-helix domain-containing protein [Nitratireductor aquimarinus]MBY6132973.1 helix-turn-helix domain-containing protein [Nitratireductor aquimarinus]MCA1301815.1 helix-turn-helix domain-containing protein [Nitratireductor aquimarinus]